MNHSFDSLIIKISGICNNCKTNVESREHITRAQMETINMLYGNNTVATNSAQEYRNYILSIAYSKLDKHPCLVINNKPIIIPIEGTP
mgnify:CR=1 FL=1